MDLGPGSEIRDPEKTYPGSRGQKGTGSWIRIRNTGIELRGQNRNLPKKYVSFLTDPHGGHASSRDQPQLVKNRLLTILKISSLF